MSASIPCSRFAFGSLVVVLLLALPAIEVHAEFLAAYSFGVDLSTEGGAPDLVADGLVVADMTLTQDGVTRGPLFYDIGSVGRGAVREGGWSPFGPDNFYETVITAAEPGTSFRITNLDFDHSSVASNGETLTIVMIPNGEEPIAVYSRGGGALPAWRGIDFCQPCFTALGWPAILERSDLQSLVIRVVYSPVSTDATFGIDEFVLSGEVLTAVSVDSQPPVGRMQVLAQNHPNPFNPRTSIPYALDRAGPVSLRVYDLKGRELRTLVDGYREAGSHVTRWDGRDGFGEPSASGIYLYRVETRDGVETRKMTLVQ